MGHVGEVNLEILDRIALLTLNRPEKHNALTQHMRGSFISLLQPLAEDENIRVVIITGAGERSFCAGTDVSEFVGRSGREQFSRDIDPLRLFEVIERFPKPVLAMINGYAFGGGCELALACDIRIASTNAQMGQLEVHFGLLPGGGGTQRLTRLVGRGQAMRLILAGDRIDGEEALRIGLVDVLTPAAELRERTIAIATRIAGNSPVAVSLAKESIRSVDELPLSAGLRYEAALMAVCMYEGDAQSRIRDFLKE